MEHVHGAFGLGGGAELVREDDVSPTWREVVPPWCLRGRATSARTTPARNPKVTGGVLHGSGRRGHEEGEGDEAIPVLSPTRREEDGGERRREESGGAFGFNGDGALQWDSGEMEVSTSFATMLRTQRWRRRGRGDDGDGARSGGGARWPTANFFNSGEQRAG